MNYYNRVPRLLSVAVSGNHYAASTPNDWGNHPDPFISYFWGFTGGTFTVLLQFLMLCYTSAGDFPE